MLPRFATPLLALSLPRLAQAVATRGAAHCVRVVSAPVMNMTKGFVNSIQFHSFSTAT